MQKKNKTPKLNEGTMYDDIIKGTNLVLLNRGTYVSKSAYGKKVAELKDCNESYERYIKTSDDFRSLANKQLEEKTETLNTLSKDYNKLVGEHRLLKNSVEESKYLANRYKEISESTFTRLMDITNQKIWACGQLGSFENKCSIQEGQITRLTKKCGGLESENKQLTLELQASTDKCAELEIKEIGYKDTIAELTFENAKLNAENKLIKNDKRLLAGMILLGAIICFIAYLLK